MRIPVTTRGIRLIAAAALAVAAAACGDEPGGSDVVTIPSSDGSSPSIVMDAHFNVEDKPYMTVAHGSAPQQSDAKPDETVTFIATGSDTDGGVKTIEIWLVEDHCGLPDPDDEVGVVCHVDYSHVVAENPDPDATKTAGASAATSRTVSYNVHFPLDRAPASRQTRRRGWSIGPARWSGAPTSRSRGGPDARPRRRSRGRQRTDIGRTDLSICAHAIGCPQRGDGPHDAPPRDDTRSVPICTARRQGQRLRSP